MKRILKTITVKYMVIFMTLIILTVFVLGTMVATILGNYSFDVTAKELSTSNVMFKAYYSELKGEETLEDTLENNSGELEKILSLTFLTSEGCQVIVADQNREIVFHAYKGDDDSTVINFLSSGTDVGILKKNIIPQKALNSFSDGENEAMNSDCEGLFVEKVIWAGTPLDNSESPAGYVVSFTDSGNEDSLFNAMLSSISLTAIWLLVTALVAIYVVSYKVMTPLREISSAAKSFARGKFDVRVPERGNDELTELARSFNKMAVEIGSKDEMQKQFLSSASHDLRTPMTTIAGFIDGILDGAIPREKQGHYLNIIKSEVQRLSRLVTSLLDISRLQSGDRKFDKKPFNICELARQTIISFENQFYEKKLDVEFDAEMFDMIAHGDKDAINQVIYNLCHNAIKFSYEGGKYRVSITYSGEDEIRFSVYNEGIGITKEELPFVFDRFYKSDKSRGLDKSGVGLGLFISKTIVDAHNGEMV